MAGSRANSPMAVVKTVRQIMESPAFEWTRYPLRALTPWYGQTRPQTMRQPERLGASACQAIKSPEGLVLYLSLILVVGYVAGLARFT